MHETHRYCVYECGQHLVVELSAAATDLPYSDAFTMETRFDVTQLEVIAGAGLVSPSMFRMSKLPLGVIVRCAEVRDFDAHQS